MYYILLQMSQCTSAVEDEDLLEHFKDLASYVHNVQLSKTRVKTNMIRPEMKQDFFATLSETLLMASRTTQENKVSKKTLKPYDYYDYDYYGHDYYYYGKTKVPLWQEVETNKPTGIFIQNMDAYSPVFMALSPSSHIACTLLFF